MRRKGRASALMTALIGAVMLLTGCGGGQKSSSEGDAIVKIEPVYDENTKVIALTFDDGPNTTTTVQMLDVLEKHGVVASFFLVGSNINEITAPIVKRAYDMGCEIANHSVSHSNMSSMTVEEMLTETQTVSDRVQEITGEPTRFFRPPYIAVSGTMFENINMPFICGYGVEDYLATVSADDRYNSVMEKAKDGAIILLHDSAGNFMTVEAVDRLIPALQAQGYVFVTVSQLFDAKGITPEAGDGILYSYAEQTTMYG